MNATPATSRFLPSQLGVVIALVAAFGLLAGMGWWVGELRSRNIAAEMREHLLQQVSDMARVLNPELAQKLTFTPADKGTPAFEVMREQLTAIGKRISSRGIFSAAQRNGKLFFGPESYAENDPLASPPGTEYQKPPKETRMVFQKRQAAIVGPYTDKFGTFVTALAPVLDPQTREVILVLGLDIRAGDWQARVNTARLEPFLASLLVTLLLVAGMAGVRWNNRRRTATHLDFKFWIVAPVALVMLAGMAAIFSYQTRNSLEESRRDTHRLMDWANSEWNRLVFNEVERLKANLDHIVRDPAVGRAWQNRNLETLATLCQPIFAELKRQSKVTHFEFVEPNRNVLLRVHNPERHGGKFDRFSQLNAVRTGTDAWGIETQGGSSILTLRYVRSWMLDGQTIGYVELGMEVNRLADMLARDLGVDILFVLRKQYSSREKFEAGKPIYGFTGSWDDYPELVVAHQTLPTLPSELEQWLKFGHQAFKDQKPFRVRQEDRTFDGGFLHLSDAAGQDVADLIVLNDMTTQVAADRGSLFLNLALALVFSASIIGLLWSVTSRTEKQLGEAFAQMQASEIRLRAITDSAQDAILMMNSQGLVSYWNPAAERLFGYTSAEATGQNLHAFIVPQRYHGAHHAAFPAFLKTGQGAALGKSLDVEARRKDGCEISVQLSLSSVQFNGSWHAVGILRDITERKQAEAQIRKLSRAVEQSPASIVITDPKGTIEYVNPKFTQVTGYTLDEARGKNPRVLKGDKTASEEYRHLWQTISQGQEWRGELHNRKKNGELYWEFASISPIVDTEGRITHFLAVKEDVTARKLAEAKLLETNQQLENAIIRANKLAIHAEQASQAKSEFLANMSHEIRTPLNGVIGMTGLLLEAGLNADQRRYAETVRNSGEALLALINDILDFSKIEAGKLELETLDFDLSSLLNDFAASLALRAHDKGLEFICSAAPDVPNWLRGDPGRLRQILTNLAGNAVKFTKQGEVVVQASLISETDMEAMLRFSVRDTGIGIPTNKKDRLFQKFTQVDASVTRHFGGTGLGLAISKQLVQMMGGDIGVESTEGRGSEFWFTTRLAKQAGREHPDLPPAELRGTHILVVDDNATNREVLKAQLQAWGVRSEETADGLSALEALKRASDAGDPFQTAILDMQMPGMDGAALGRAIKTDAQLNTTRLVMLSSLGRRGDTELMDQIGFAACLTKPARPSELFDCLASALTRASLPPSAQPAPILPQVGESGMGTMRILLAEDNLTNQQVALGMLKRLGLQAHVVDNGADAVKALEAHPFDLVFMDMQMPVMDGLEATRQIRKVESQRLQTKGEGLYSTSPSPIPIIAMTANAMQGDREKCLASGMNDYLSKPVTFQALVAALEKWRPQETEKMVTSATSVPEKAAPIYTKGLEVPVFDHAEMMDRFMDDAELAHSVVETFLDDTPRQIRALKGYLVARDIPSTQRQAHTIKGAAANVSGQMLRAVAFEMEQAARAGDLETVTARLPELELQFTRLQEAISEYDMQIVTR